MIITDHKIPNTNIHLPALPQTDISWSLSEITPNSSGDVMPSSHGYYEIYIHVFGDVSLASDGRLYLLSPGDIAILPPYTVHRLISLHKAARYYSLRIPEASGTDCFSPLYRQAACRYLSPNISEAGQLFALCSGLDATVKTGPYGTAKHLASVFALIALIEDILASGHLLSPTPLSSELAEVVEFLESFYPNPLTLSDIYGHVGISPQTLAKLFRSELDTTPISYLLDLRLRKARSILSTALPLSEICKSCGFADYSRFIERFRKAYGITPHKLRQLYFANAR